MIRTLIIEDEEIAAIRLQRMAQEALPEISVVKLIESVSEAVSFLQHAQVDLIFMDINLVDGHSFEIFEQVTVTSPIIFTTAYSEYAIKAFEQNSIDYLLKPIAVEALQKSLDKYQRLQKGTVPDYKKVFEAGSDAYKQRFLIKKNNRLKSISVSETAYFYAEERVSFLITANGERVVVNETLKTLENTLNPADFFRINRQFIVHRSAIADMYYTSKSRIRLMLNPSYDDKPVVVAIEKIGSFKKWLS